MNQLQNYGLTEISDMAYDLNIITTDLYDQWHAELGPRHQNWLASQNFTPKPGVAVCLPDKNGHIEQAVGVVESPYIWNGAKLSSSLPNAIWALQVYKNSIDHDQLGQVTLGWGLANYRFDRYRNQTKTTLNQLICPKNVPVSWLNGLLSGTYLCRDLINLPSNHLTPVELETAARQLAAAHQANITTHKGDQLATTFPAIHTVGRAAEVGPRLIDMRWGDSGPKITLVGKGITFDSGGLDLKPSKAMETMKKDMGGAATVLGLAEALMTCGTKIQLRVLIATAENAVSDRAMRPLDIIDTRAGIKVEVGNTDAEGRLVLADAIDYAIEDQPDFLIDFATLTGSARVALGTELPALFANKQDTANDLLAASRRSADPLWQLPLFDDYERHLDAGYAALSSTGLSAYGGAITAALFLRRFAGRATNWAHIDVMAWNLVARPGRPKGGEAMGLRAVFEYIRTLATDR
tara:strand:+ start:2275 stop:3669 length:1395 start_codon:yes stop_codon:yes gene_type:complete